MNTPQKIAVIGPTQSGKTCLAIGLFSTSTHGFTIATPNIDDRNYLADRRKEIVGGEWPAANIKGRPHPLRFDFQKKGHDSITVTFPEFAGELLGNDEEFDALANEHFRDLAGVVLLVNPGADAFQKDDTRLLEDAKTQYQRILSFLKDPNHGSDKAFVALTVTAADRLYGLNADLRGKDAAFRDCIEDIENSLSTSNFRWKKFYVSMSGPTDAENKFKRKSVPKGFPNTSSKPFLWILYKLFWLPIRAKILRRLAAVGAIAVALLAAAGVGCWLSASDARRFVLGERAAVEKELEAAGSTSRNCEKAFDNAKPHLDNLKTYGRFWHKGLAASTYNGLEPKAWDVLQRAILRSQADLREDLRQNPTNCVGRTKEIDAFFDKFVPSGAELQNRRIELKAEWDKEKAAIDEQISIAVMTGSIRKVLDESVGKHGDEVLASLLGLYAELSKVNPPEGATNLVQRRAALADEIDARLVAEWKEYAVPGFGKAAPNTATDEAVRSFVERLEAWTPATTNGANARVELLASVTNSIPEWRTSYEENRIRTLAANAAQSRDMAKMAASFPSRVSTNKYLTAEYVESVWNDTVKTAFEEAEQKFIDEIVGDVTKRRGKPELTEVEEGRIRDEASRVGQPLDFAELSATIQQRVDGKSREWLDAKRRECEEWVRDNVRSDRKRTGRGSLWDDYETFMRKNHEDNPLAESIVRAAVYQQIENWFESDIRKFKAFKLTKDIVGDISDAFDRKFKAFKLTKDIVGDISDAFEPFKFLCRRVSEDKCPLRTSWAWHFACDCVNRGKIDSISTCFPQRLSFTKVEGKIDYGDFRNTYIGTDLSVMVVSQPIEGERDGGSLVSSQTLEKRNNHKWKQLRFSPRSVRFHSFDVVRISLKTVDRIVWGRNLECDVDNLVASGFELGRKNWLSGVEFGKEFNLMQDKIIKDVPLTTKDSKPEAYIRLYGTIEGDSIDDFMTKAKNVANKEKARGN